jgi:hypothetical protein
MHVYRGVPGKTLSSLRRNVISLSKLALFFVSNCNVVHDNKYEGEQTALIGSLSRRSERSQKKIQISNVCADLRGCSILLVAPRARAQVRTPRSQSLQVSHTYRQFLPPHAFDTKMTKNGKHVSKEISICFIMFQ